jgi:hypothetical protein
MEKESRFSANLLPVVIFLLVAALIPTAYARLSPSTARGKLTSRTGNETKSTATAPPAGYARPILWRNPGDPGRRDLFYGSGGREGAPKPSARYTFIRHSDSGTQKKIIVKDNLGREWTVKFGREARPETAATRIVWAAGYHVDQTYFVKRALIDGKERFDARNVRFERRNDGYQEIDNWKWKDNPFEGTREMDGLRVLMALLKNWDLKESNNKILRHRRTGANVYYVSDLGASFGRTGSWLNKIPIFADMPPDKAGGNKGKGHPEAFAGEDFIKKVDDGRVIFHFERSRGRSILNGVPIVNARWMGNILGRLSDKQLADAFRAGGFNQAEVKMYVSTLRARINRLRSLEYYDEVVRRD